MNVQTEHQLEAELVAQLAGMGWTPADIPNEAALVANLKAQLEAHNGITLSEGEFGQVLNALSRGSIFEKAKTLRGKLDYRRDDGTVGYLELLNQVQWCKNRYQVAQQVTMVGKYVNRYDVTLLVNGLPLAQVELKRRGLELKEAFNQTGRYHQHSYGAGYGLFDYIQIFVISNGVNTRYFANASRDQRDYRQTFFWAGEDNTRISQLADFGAAFLEPCHLSKMITHYTVLHETRQALMVLRPYQFYAVEALVARVRSGTRKNGYIWHTTGSGKTLTSFKAAQVLTRDPDVHKVVFVVDRRDLDFQTVKEFNAYRPDSVDGTENTRALVRQFSDDTPLIVTTLQKLNAAISRKGHQSRMEALRDKRMVFIFDECHRSQFGDTHKRITEYFRDVQMFGFTGTPIFVENAVKLMGRTRTTSDLFGDELHRYVITDAIRDENVLKFAVEYVRTVKRKGQDEALETATGEAVPKEVLEARDRLDKVVDYIIEHHGSKTHGRTFTALLCVSSVNALRTVYDLFKAKAAAGEHDLTVATIFSWAANEEEPDALDPMALPASGGGASRDALEVAIGDYNRRFGTNYSTESFYDYYKDIGKRVRNREVDILLVVNMFLTGFDSPPLNTIYVDKTLRQHGLIQAFSRTNRLMGQKKTHGNVVCFRDLKANTDEAIALFASGGQEADILAPPYEDLKERLTEAVQRLHALVPEAGAVDHLTDEAAEAEFVQAFREVIRVKTAMETYAEHDRESQPIGEQEFADYRSKYLDLHDKTRRERKTQEDDDGADSPLDDLDFEVELLSRDVINVAYILNLIAGLAESGPEAAEAGRKRIADILDGEVSLRDKRVLITRFLDEELWRIQPGEDPRPRFWAFWEQERKAAQAALVESEDLDPDRVEDLLKGYAFTGRRPLQDALIGALRQRPRLLERRARGERVWNRLREHIDTFTEGLG